MHSAGQKSMAMTHNMVMMTVMTMILSSGLTCQRSTEWDNGQPVTSAKLVGPLLTCVLVTRIAPITKR